MANSEFVLFAEKMSEDRVLGKQGDAMSLAGAVRKVLVHVLCVTALVGCATGGTPSDTSRCFPYCVTVGIEILNLNLESTASKIVMDAISSMGYLDSEEGYVTPSRECFITIERPEGSYADYIEINLYLSDQHPSDPSEWISQMQEILVSSVAILGLEDELEVLQVLHPASYCATWTQSPGD